MLYTEVGMGEQKYVIWNCYLLNIFELFTLCGYLVWTTWVPCVRESGWKMNPTPQLSKTRKFSQAFAIKYRKISWQMLIVSLSSMPELVSPLIRLGCSGDRHQKATRVKPTSFWIEWISNFFLKLFLSINNTMVSTTCPVCTTKVVDIGRIPLTFRRVRCHRCYNVTPLNFRRFQLQIVI